ncbi:anaerobic dimethyl sulfoxide reductase maturation protein (twin-arginine leader-binding protein) [Escherichia coli]|uniref:Anaerobic dimethyl sulfoxide reductase maturation protein (Twin-arginine leader-binding protein) n=1 Tax=Escherichia coli TaxID=562 RepID=A0A484X6H4_ECOLX|nr:anaerobic dimethyl sulfoxide reductase maturation protein (twin-arginine leader-binding protein) [Escherichia coli]
MTHFSQQDNFSVAARVLGALFYYAPESAEAAPLVAVLTNDSWETQWPLPEASLAPLVTAFQTQSEETHAQAWQRLFVGPWALPSPPWGSVWLDRESVLFGDSTLALRQWMRRERHSVRNEAKRTGRSFWFTAADGCVVGGEWSPDRMRRIAGMAPFSVVNTFS